MVIKSKSELKYYLNCDRIALGIPENADLKTYLTNDIWRFQRLMRKIEYYTNCRYDIPGRVYRLFLRFRYRQLGMKLGYSIPVNAFGPGLSIAHYGTIVVNDSARVGANCRLHVCVNIGTEAGKSDSAPIIGDNAYIGPGVKLFGSIKLGDNIAIGANAVVNKSFEEDSITIAGIPARKISSRSSEGLLIKATEILGVKDFN